MDKLLNLGFNDTFRLGVDPEKIRNHDFARVVAVHKDGYFVSRGNEVIFAELSGTLQYTADSSMDLPTTGDWVLANFYDDDSHAIIHYLLKRKTLLRRKSAGKTVDFQLIAANIDTAFIIQSLDENLNLRRLERYLVMVYEAHLAPYILLSKCDLVSTEELSNVMRRIDSIAPDISRLSFSNMSGENIQQINMLLVAGQTFCLLGSSGVGKTSLLNRIIGNDKFATQTVSKKQSKGRHTTTSRELIQLASGAVMIDTPGMRELGNFSVGEGLDKTFSDVLELAQQCKFADCKHVHEKGCAILAATANQSLPLERYRNYLKIKKEADINDMSYVEKRRRDKSFGKLIKSVQKTKQRWRD